MVRVPFTYGRVTRAGAAGLPSEVTFDATGTYAIDLARFPWLASAQGVLSYDPVHARVAQDAMDICVCARAQSISCWRRELIARRAHAVVGHRRAAAERAAADVH